MYEKKWFVFFLQIITGNEKVSIYTQYYNTHILKY